MARNTFGPRFLAFVGALAVLVTTGSSVGIAQDERRPAPAPLIVDVNGDGYSLTSAVDGVRFDLDGDGIAKQIAWTAAGSDDAFLAIDENHNGRIDSGHELLGAWQVGPPNGFSALGTLAAYDRGNVATPAVINAQDSVFKRLILWTDRNHNGVSEEDELEALSHAGFTQVFLGYELIGAADRAGNIFQAQAQALRMSNQGVEVARYITAIQLAR